MAQSADNPYGLVSFGHVSINPQHIVVVKVKLGSPTGRKEFEKIMKDYHELVDRGRREVFRIEQAP